VYGIGLYAGYERMYKKLFFIKDSVSESISNENFHNKKKYSESILFGLQKSYGISDKLQGRLQLLYDIWWQEKNLKTPLQLRFTINKK